MIRHANVNIVMPVTPLKMLILAERRKSSAITANTGLCKGWHFPLPVGYMARCWKRRHVSLLVGYRYTSRYKGDEISSYLLVIRHVIKEIKFPLTCWLTSRYKGDEISPYLLVIWHVVGKDDSVQPTIVAARCAQH